MSQPAGTILVADDEESIRSVLTEILAGLGYEVIAVGDSAAVVKLLTQQDSAIRLALLDATLPELDQRLREAPRQADVPLVFMSGYQPTEVSVTSVAGASFLQKPFSPDDVAAIVRANLA